MENQVHATAVIGPGVELAEDVVIGPYAVVTGPCRIGAGTWLGAHVVVGAPPEIRGHDQGTPWGDVAVGAGVEIGAGTVLREFATVHSGFARPTRVGSRCFVMNKVYIGHDGDIGDDVTMAAAVSLGGHVSIGPGANLGLGAVVHQRRVVGPGAMVGMGSVVTRDVPPFARVFGAPARVRGANEVGMSRGGANADAIAVVTAHYGSTEVTGTWRPPAGLDLAWQWYAERTAVD
jgi:UDP-N-acetylglucosamine acyltransferase